MNKILFQNNTIISPEWLNAIQNLSYEKQSNEFSLLKQYNQPTMLQLRRIKKCLTIN
jgi:hypothetical protein